MVWFVSVDMAVNKSARQYDEFTEMNAFLAVDGNLSTCSHTSLQAQPWWEVNFGQRFIVQGLVLDVPQDNLRMYYFQFSFKYDRATMVWL